MKNHFLPFVIAAAVVVLAGGCVAGNRTGTVGNAVISDEALITLSREMRVVGDGENTVAPESSRYVRRLTRLGERFANEDDPKCAFKVYLAGDVEANATADGAIRVYSGLMDMMTDNELLFILGHEVGHVKNGDCLDAVRMAYVSSEEVKMASVEGQAGETGLSDAQLGNLLRAVLARRFSDAQESQADAYAYGLMRKYGLDTKAAVSALRKLGSLDSDAGGMAGHQNAGERAATIQTMIDADAGKK